MMNEKETVENFIDCFKKHDVSGMCRNYDSEIVYFDPLADLLKENEVRARWILFFEDASNCEIACEEIVEEGDGYYTCKWIANFMHSESNRKVILQSKSNFKLENNMITEHGEAFSLHQYCIQVYGAVAYVIGRNSLYQRARKNEFRRRINHQL